jgi:hypothetical protein
MHKCLHGVATQVSKNKKQVTLHITNPLYIQAYNM